MKCYEISKSTISPSFSFSSISHSLFLNRNLSLLLSGAQRRRVFLSTDNELAEAVETKPSSSNSDRVGGDNNAGPPRKKIERDEEDRKK